MRFLTVVRHAKAETATANDQDLQRPLTTGGRKSLKRIARVLTKLDPQPEIIVSSHAVRARQTAEGIAARIEDVRPILLREEIYTAQSVTLLNVLCGLPEDVRHAVLVGHNPGLEELVTGLCSGATNRFGVRLGKGGIAHLQLEIHWWNQLRWGAGQLQLLIRPKFLTK